MRNPIKAATAILALAAMLAGSGCSWWRHRREAPAPEATPEAAAEAAPAAALPTAPAPLTPDAEALRAATQLAADFYEMRLRLGRSGLPDAVEMRAYRVFLCAPLADSMDLARERQADYMAAHPDDKPPLVEGDLFSSLFEGPDVVSAGLTEVEGEGASVTMSMRSGEGDNAPHWKDRVLLARERDVWCIADIEYRGDWPFANKGKLSDVLAKPF